MINPQSQRHAKNILRRNSLICYEPIRQRMGRSGYSLLRAIRATCYAAALCATPSDAQPQQSPQQSNHEARVSELAKAISAYKPPPPNPYNQAWEAKGLNAEQRAALDQIAFTIWNEAREEGKAAIYAVADVIRNRAGWGSITPLQVVQGEQGNAVKLGWKFPYGERLFKGYDPNPPDDFTLYGFKRPESQAWIYCYDAAERTMRKNYYTVLNSDHFYSGEPPSWAKYMVNKKQFGNMTFGRMKRDRNW